jgi:hypothetical protein
MDTGLDDSFSAMTPRLEVIATRTSQALSFMKQPPSHLIKEREGYNAIFFKCIHAVAVITPYKDDDEIDFVAICEPSANDRMAAGKYPKTILPHLTLTQEESGPNTVKLSQVFLRTCSSDLSAFLEHFP